ncbi:MAG: tRNA (adenosine(37)-N6)-dimethylallyltransferase MiaA [Clostridia bacterium]|nr:tRNA (adenosine(37)-N6)-dimethylallyltransferase MiaA [Clostridia bacterium]
MNNKPTVLAIIGPTASGKSALAVALAKALGGEIISCDSMQIYREMNVGTAKPTEEEMQGIKHHLIDFLEPTSAFSCSDFATLARAAADNIISRGGLPILCGGTGLYLDAFIRGNSPSPDADKGADLEYRARLESVAIEQGTIVLHEMLKEVDPDSAENIHPNNQKRIIRALEVYHNTGIPKSEHDRRSKSFECPYNVLIIGLRFADRELLYRRIEKRVDLMIENGLVDEVKALDVKGVFEVSPTASQAIGYKELLAYVRGLTDLDTCTEELKKATRRYAKRQMTWFTRYENIHWITVDSADSETNKVLTFEDIVNIAKKLYADFISCGII